MDRMEHDFVGPVKMIRYEMVLGIDLIDCLASYDEGLSGDI